jgi:hypothetical protein
LRARISCWQIAHRQQDREAADHTDRHRDRRNQGCAQAAEKQKDNDHDEAEGDEERDRDIVDRGKDKRRRIVIDQIFQTGRETLAQSAVVQTRSADGYAGLLNGRIRPWTSWSA